MAENEIPSNNTYKESNDRNVSLEKASSNLAVLNTCKIVVGCITALLLIKYMKNACSEAHERGYKRGYDKGRKIGYHRGYQRGHQSGWNDGLLYD